MKLQEKYPTIIAQRGEKTTLNANITKKLTEAELTELEAAWPGLPKNEQLYCELVGPSRGCTECGEPVKFINFSQGYKELCPVCKKKQTVAASKKSIAETKGEIVEDYEIGKWAVYLRTGGLDADKWTQHTRAHNVNVWWTVKQSASTKTWMEALYRWEYPEINNSCKTCGKPTRFANYNVGYRTYCCATCARQDDEVNARIAKAGSATKLKKAAEKNTGMTSYCNYELYTDPVEANRKYVNNYGMTLEEFDKAVPVLDWCDNTDYKQRYYYHINKIKEQKVCSCGNKIERYRHDYCSIGCVNRDEGVRAKIVETNLERYGAEYHSVSSHGTRYRRYKYEMPSGAEIVLQGYEKWLIDDLLEMGIAEEDIVAGHELKTVINYEDLDGKSHRYYPDVYVKSINTLYEVKSEWTIKLAEKNDIIGCKMRGCEDRGFKAVCVVYKSKNSKYEYKFD